MTYLSLMYLGVIVCLVLILLGYAKSSLEAYMVQYVVLCASGTRRVILLAIPRGALSQEEFVPELEKLGPSDFLLKYGMTSDNMSVFLLLRHWLDTHAELSVTILENGSTWIAPDGGALLVMSGDFLEHSCQLRNPVGLLTVRHGVVSVTDSVHLKAVPVVSICP